MIQQYKGIITMDEERYIKSKLDEYPSYTHVQTHILTYPPTYTRTQHTRTCTLLQINQRNTRTHTHARVRYCRLTNAHTRTHRHTHVYVTAD